MGNLLYKLQNTKERINVIFNITDLMEFCFMHTNKTSVVKVHPLILPKTKFSRKRIGLFSKEQNQF